MRRLPRPSLVAVLALAASALSGLAAGCAGADRLSRGELEGTVWREVCPNPQIATATVRLDPGGAVAWSYDGPGALAADTMHAWAVERGALVLRWNRGHAFSRYRAGRDLDRLVADSSTFCVDAPPVLERVP